MNFQISFCDPFKPDIIDLGEVPGSKIPGIFNKIPWDDILDKAEQASDQEIYYSLTFSVVNTANGISLDIIANKKNDWQLYYSRPRKVAVVFGMIKRMNRNCLSDVQGKTRNDAMNCINAMINNKQDYLESVIPYDRKNVSPDTFTLEDLAEMILSVIGFLLPLAGMMIVSVGFYFIKVTDFSKAGGYILTGIILMIWGHRLIYLPSYYKGRKERKKQLAKIQYLRSRGRHIRVPVSQITVSGSVRKTIIQAIPPRNVFGLLIAGWRGEDRVHDINDFRGTSFLIYRKKTDEGFIEFQSDPIKKQPVTLEFELEKIKEIDLYIDPSDSSNYYLDTDQFLR